MSTIVLKFSGPLQSWGTNSRFESRLTDRYPSKSAVIGLIAACLGYRRNDDEQIETLKNLDFSVRVDHPGSSLRDFHIATKYKKDGTLDRTYVTNRYYLQDAVFLVGISSRNEELINSIEVALKEPYFQPFLGRRSLAVNFDYYQGRFEGDVVKVLKEFPYLASTVIQKKQGNGLKMYSDSELLLSGFLYYSKDNIISLSNKHRRYGLRGIKETTIELKVQEYCLDHDIFKNMED